MPGGAASRGCRLDGTPSVEAETHKLADQGFRNARDRVWFIPHGREAYFFTQTKFQ